MYNYGRGDFKELAHVIVEAGESKICRVDQQAADPGKELMLPFESKGRLQAEFPLF